MALTVTSKLSNSTLDPQLVKILQDLENCIPVFSTYRDATWNESYVTAPIEIIYELTLDNRLALCMYSMNFSLKTTLGQSTYTILTNVPKIRASIINTQVYSTTSTLLNRHCITWSDTHVTIDTRYITETSLISYAGICIVHQ